MAADVSAVPYLFVVDTKDYAGNFEREMVAFMTGQVGECGVGEEAQAKFLETYPDATLPVVDWLLVNVLQWPDDEIACRRPATIYLSPGGGFNSVALCLQERPTSEVVDFLKERAQLFAEDYDGLTRFSGRKGQKTTITGFRLVRNVITTTEEVV